MNLTKLALLSCPVILASVVLVSNPAEASVSMPSSQSNPLSAIADPGVTLAVSPPSDRPLVPTGCSCARCTRAEDLLQGQFPVF